MDLGNLVIQGMMIPKMSDFLEIVTNISSTKILNITFLLRLNLAI